MPLVLRTFHRKVTSEERYRRILSEKTEADKALDRVINRMLYGPQGYGKEKEEDLRTTVRR